MRVTTDSNLRCMVRFLVSDRLIVDIITNVRNVSFPGVPKALRWTPKTEPLGMLARFARALHAAIKKGRGAHTFSPREKVPRRGG
jgi:hypothetical protein